MKAGLRLLLYYGIIVREKEVWYKTLIICPCVYVNYNVIHTGNVIWSNPFHDG